jgi:alpha-galactosidase
MSRDYLRVTVTLRSGQTTTFDDISLTVPEQRHHDGVALRTGVSHPLPVTVAVDDTADPVESISYDLFTRMQNLRHVVLPDSGRWYMNGLHPISAWRFHRELDSAVNDVKTPLYVFTGHDRNTAVALGLIGRPYETSCEILEPVSNRALNVHVRQIGVRFQRGSSDFPLPAHVWEPNGEITEYVFHHRPAAEEREPWLVTMRKFAAHQRSLYSLTDDAPARALDPIWCTWADWSSDDLTDELILGNAAKGLDLGIRNFIIDDGWFGPGLDSDYGTELNIGDWEPDTTKIKDLAGLVRDIRSLGGATLIWCAPHAVGPAAKCFDERAPLLIQDRDGKPVLNPTQFYALCFRSPQARQVMTDVCVELLRRWDFDGAKYDLFNWVPNVCCHSSQHSHDTDSMLHGLYLTLRSIDEATRAIKPDYLVELKQNYGTPFFCEIGSMMRAGDAPYAPETNFLRTLHVQGYTPFALNDYQNFTDDDNAQDVAVTVITMMAAGIPAYSVDLSRLGEQRESVLRRYHAWYQSKIEVLRSHRTPADPDNNIMTVSSAGEDIVFLVGNGGPVTITDTKPTTILNGTYAEEIFLRIGDCGPLEVVSLDAFGDPIDRFVTDPTQSWAVVRSCPGGSHVVRAC